jgi:uncharacterized protein (TIGR02266 family)
MSLGRKILVVDEVPMFREIIGLFLARSGRVLGAGSGEEAVALARRERPDVILVDLFLPDGDGVDLVRTMRQDALLANTPAIVLSGSPAAADRARALRAGANDVLSKPLDRFSLIEAVNRFLRPGLPRGLPRVEVEARVRFRAGDHEGWGTARNLSRGGMFVAATATAPPESEVALEFPLPETDRVLATTARVVWCREGAGRSSGGMGLCFLELDAESARSIDVFVHERLAYPTELARASGMA